MRETVLLPAGSLDLPDGCPHNVVFVVWEISQATYTKSPLKPTPGLNGPPALAPPPKSECSASKIFRHSGMTLIFKTTFEVFTRVGPDNSLERLTERSVGLVTDRPSNVYELFVTLF